MFLSVSGETELTSFTATAAATVTSNNIGMTSSSDSVEELTTATDRVSTALTDHDVTTVSGVQSTTAASRGNNTTQTTNGNYSRETTSAAASQPTASQPRGDHNVTSDGLDEVTTTARQRRDQPTTAPGTQTTTAGDN